VVAAMSENMRLYSAFEHTPYEAKKPIEAGRLKGKTDINPMYRIKKLTEKFGPCGIGWYTEILSKSTQEGPNGELMGFMDIHLYYRENGTGEWSKPVFGTGGNTIISKENKGLYANDEGWKMVYTDALSVACKNLGICADVYFEKDYSKYSQPKHESFEQSNSKSAQQPHQQVQASPPPTQQPRMAAPWQKKFIIDNATDEEYEATMKVYGAELENMPFAHAEKLTAKIQRRMNPNG
jgi:hypothetical protein